MWSVCGLMSAALLGYEKLTGVFIVPQSAPSVSCFGEGSDFMPLDCMHNQRSDGRPCMELELG
jgi:hypothetical protein